MLAVAPGFSDSGSRAPPGCHSGSVPECGITCRAGLYFCLFSQLICGQPLNMVSGN